MATTLNSSDAPPPDTASRQTASKIRAHMAAHSPRYTGKDLARALNISPQSASRRLNGQHDFKLNELEDIAKWLKVPVKSLLLPLDAET